MKTEGVKSIDAVPLHASPIPGQEFVTEALLFDDKFLGVSVAHIAVGKECPPHSHDDREQVYYIVNGKGKLTLGDGQYDVSEGSVVHISLNTLHGMRNVGDEPLVYIYFVAWTGEPPS